jgi:hypothetical protein
MVTMQALFGLTGFNRLLGLSHVLWWTPLLVYLARQRPRLVAHTTFSRWVGILLATIALSLILDYLDVARYLFGDRA